MDAPSPSTLAGQWRLLRAQGGDAAVTPLRKRLLRLQLRLAAVDRQSIIVLSSVAPPLAAGQWVPELTEIVGADSLVSVKGGAPAPVPDGTNPDIILVAIAGQDLAAAIAAAQLYRLRIGYSGQLFAADGQQLFNVGGRALADSAEALADMLHGLDAPALRSLWTAL
jgi:iron complex transport system substrate-binding protein